jgi:phage-related baseplate assembly protein
MAELDLFVVDDAAIQQEVTEHIEDNLNETLYPGDERKIFTEVLLGWVIGFLVTLNEKFNQRFAQYAKGIILDAHGENEGCERLPKMKATSTERFKLAGTLTRNIVIPAGTRVTGDEEKYFATDNVAVIYAGQTQVDVPISAVEGGAGYNGYTIGQLNKLVDKIEYISEVTNLSATTGGDDGEPYPEEDEGIGDKHYYERIRLVKAAKTTAGAEETYKYYADLINRIDYIV